MSECPVEQPTDEVLRPLPHPAGRSPLTPTSTDYPAPRPGDRDALAGGEDTLGGSEEARLSVDEDARVASLDAWRAARLARSGWGLYRLPVWAAAAGWRPPDDTTWVTFLTRRRRLAASYGRHGMLNRFEPPEDHSRGAALYQALVTQDTSALEDTGWLDRVETITRLEARLAAMKAEAITGYDDTQHGISADLGHTRPEPGDRAATAGERRWHHGQLRSVSDEIGLVLGLHRAAATSRIHSSWELVHNYPATWAALTDGELTERAAFTIVSELSALDDVDDLRAAEAAVLDWARSHPLQRIKQAAQAEAARRDAAATDKSHKRARDDRSVRMLSTEFGTAELIHSQDAADAAAVMTSLSRAALRHRRLGDTRTMDQLRADIALTRLLPRSKHTNNPAPDTTDTTTDATDVASADTDAGAGANGAPADADATTDPRTADTGLGADIDASAGTHNNSAPAAADHVADSDVDRGVATDVDADNDTGNDNAHTTDPDHTYSDRDHGDDSYHDGAYADSSTYADCDGADGDCFEDAYADGAYADRDDGDGDYGDGDYGDGDNGDDDDARVDGAYADSAHTDSAYGDTGTSTASDPPHAPDSHTGDGDYGDGDDEVVDEATVGADGRVVIHATGAELRALLNGDQSTGGELEGYGPIPQNSLRKALIKALTHTLHPAQPTTPDSASDSNHEIVDEATIGADAHVVIHATGAELRALLNGDQSTGGELEGHGPIPQNSLRKALIKALTQALLPALPTTPTNGRRGTRVNGSRIDIRVTDQPPASDPDKYTPSAALDRYVRLRDRTCRFPACNRPAEYTDIDHRQAFAAGGRTTADNLHCLCRHHHRLKHEGNWTVHPNPDGSQTWTSPTGRQYLDDNPDP